MGEAAFVVDEQEPHAPRLARQAERAHRLSAISQRPSCTLDP
jgi:hypothetical protein